VRELVPNVGLRTEWPRRHRVVTDTALCFLSERISRALAVELALRALRAVENQYAVRGEVRLPAVLVVG